MIILSTPGWEDYTLLDSGEGKRLEKFGPYTLSRPDPQCIWKQHGSSSEWEEADAIFRETGRKGHWLRKKQIPENWEMMYKQLKFSARLSPFKHTGIFPEQHIHWDWLEAKVKSSHFAGASKEKEKLKVESERNIKILNLFGYTGIASLVCAANGAEVTHVDASFPTIGWAKENQALSNLTTKKIRWILDDCMKFVEREVRRGNTYDGIIMDPPVFGHGPKGERWEFSEKFPMLLALCKQILTKQPLFLLINAYAVSASGIMLQNVLEDTMKEYGGTIEAGELALEEKGSKRLLSTGIFGRWSR